MRRTYLPVTICSAVFLLCGASARGTCAEDAYESGGTCYSALAIADGDLQQREFCASSEDWAVLNACRGRVYVLETAGLGAVADTILELYGPDCVSLLASNDNAGGGLASRIVWAAPESGLYHVRVRQADGSFGPGREYGLRVSGDTSSCETYSRAYSLTTPGEGVRGITISDGGTLAFYSGSNIGPRGTETIAVRLTPTGSVSLRTSLGTSTNDRALRAVQTADGGFLLMGVGNFGSTLWLVKLSSLGQVVSQQGFSAFLYTQTQSDLITLPDGGVMLASTRIYAGGITDVWLVRLDKNGVVQWTRGYDGTLPPDETESDDRPLAIRQMPDGGFALLAINGPPLETAWLARLTSTADVLWSRDRGYSPCGAGPPAGAGALAVTSDGGIVFALETVTMGTRIGKFDASGSGVWVKYGGPQSPRSLVATLDGGVVLAATLGQINARDASVIRFDASGA